MFLFNSDNYKNHIFNQFFTPMRGGGELSGSKAFLTNLEIRFDGFPVDHIAGIKEGRPSFLGAYYLQTYLFMDFGGAWDDKFEVVTRDENGTKQLKNTLAAYGIGWRAFAGILFVDVNVGYRLNPNHFFKHGDSGVSVSVGRGP